MLTLQIPAIKFPTSTSPPLHRPPKTTTRAQTTFLDLTPTHKPESLSIDIPYHDPSARLSYDAAIIGCGPAGLRLAEQASSFGLRVCCIDPAPLALWPNNYGAWVDELHPLGLDSCFDHIWPTASVIIENPKTKHLVRPYGRVSRRKLKTLLLENCASKGVRFHRAKAWSVNHEEFRSEISCSDGYDIKASLVVDAGGFGSTFVEQDRRGQGFQIAHGILAEVDRHPFDLDKMLLMDWRDAHLGNEPYLRIQNAKVPTFLYAMPFDSNLVFLEETSLVSRPPVPYGEIKKRMVARLRHLGIRVRRVIEEEKCLIPMGGALPRVSQRVVGFGGKGGVVHPSTGYMMARAMALAPEVAEAMAECLGSMRMIRGRAMEGRVWERLWPMERRLEREYYRFGMEVLLKMDLKGTRRFFDAFFDLEKRDWEGFLSSRLSIWELARLSLSLFGHASNPSKVDIVTKCPLPLARMMGNLAGESI